MLKGVLIGLTPVAVLLIAAGCYWLADRWSWNPILSFKVAFGFLSIVAGVSAGLWM